MDWYQVTIWQFQIYFKGFLVTRGYFVVSPDLAATCRHVTGLPFFPVTSRDKLRSVPILMLSYP